jgi:opacity protein-like surface antigen
MKNIQILLALILIALTGRAQNTGIPGYIIRNSGDTVHGILKEPGLSNLFKQAYFKSSPADNDFTVYTPAEIKGFQYEDGNLYRAVTFLDTWMDHPAFETGFARLLVSGEYDLYSFYNSSVLFFLVRKDTTFTLLFDDDIHTLPVVSGNFRNQLNFFAVGCEAMRSHIESMVYSESNLMSYFKDLDACLNPNKAVVNYYHKAKAHLGFFVYGGGSVLGTDMSQLTAEARLRLVYPHFNPSVSINLGFRYVEVTKHLADPTYLVATYYHKVSYAVESVPLTIQYNFTRGIVQPFVFVGVSLYKQNITSDTPVFAEADSFNNEFHIALPAGLGVEANITGFLAARLEWRYEYIAQWPTIGLSVKF